MDPIYYAIFAIIFVVLLYIARQYFAGGRCYSKARLEGKVVVITGSNTGIGKETAVDLAKRGATVVMACRDIKKGKTALAEVKERSGSNNVLLKELNLASLQSVREFSSSFLEEFSQLNILINNAGVMWCPYMLTEDGFEMQFGVNHLGHFALTNLLLERIVQSGPSRIVTVSSIGHLPGYINFKDINFKMGYNSVTAYGQSKLANILFTKELHKKLAGTNVTTYALHPGGVMTDLTRHLGIWATVTTYLFRLFLKTPEQGAQTSIYCAVQEGIEKHSGMYFADCHLRESSKTSMDEGIAKKLWEVSEEMTGVKFQI